MKVLGNGSISNREHLLWWLLVASTCYGLFIFLNCCTVAPECEKSSSIELAWLVLIYARLCTLFFSCRSQRILWAISEWLKWVQILRASARRCLLLSSFLGKSSSSRFRRCAKRATCVNWPFHAALTTLSLIIKPRERPWGGWISYMLIWSWSFDIWSLLHSDRPSAACFVKCLTKS